jgi:hypothetical protein
MTGILFGDIPSELPSVYVAPVGRELYSSKEIQQRDLPRAVSQGSLGLGLASGVTHSMAIRKRTGPLTERIM